MKFEYLFFFVVNAIAIFLPDFLLQHKEGRIKVLPWVIGATTACIVMAELPLHYVVMSQPQILLFLGLLMFIEILKTFSKKSIIDNYEQIKMCYLLGALLVLPFIKVVT